MRSIGSVFSRVFDLSFRWILEHFIPFIDFVDRFIEKRNRSCIGSQMLSGDGIYLSANVIDERPSP